MATACETPGPVVIGYSVAGKDLRMDRQPALSCCDEILQKLKQRNAVMPLDRHVPSQEFLDELSVAVAAAESALDKAGANWSASAILSNLRMLMRDIRLAIKWAAGNPPDCPDPTLVLPGVLKELGYTLASDNGVRS